ncbi:MAG TPA: transketolase C-terminal domain-containing protein, partial [Bacteroidia bacterium]|nr:transketolase C-terminal domain-containing protein [Bacteroidia bacterium]
MRGHEEASGTKYVPQELFDVWGRKDPVKNYEQYLLNEGVLDDAFIEQIRSEIKTEIEAGLNITYAEPLPTSTTEKELQAIYAPHQQQNTMPLQSKSNDLRFLDALTQAMEQSMEKFDNLVIMGQDIAEYGGVFKATAGFVERFGKGRIRNTPICESAIVGAGLGLAINGYKAIVEMQFADFVTCGFNQIVNNLAKTHYRWGQNADVVVRMPTGAAVGAGPFHSQSTESWFMQTPGLKVVYPAFPADAKGLLTAAIADPNPVMFFEHKALYRSVTQAVPAEFYTLEIGKAALVTSGTEITIVTYGLGVHWAIDALKSNPQIQADLIDLRTLLPWDKETVLASVKKTGKCIVLYETTYTAGVGAEIAAFVSEHAFSCLDAPVVRVASLDTPVPMSEELEWNFLPKKRFSEALLKLHQY